MPWRPSPPSPGHRPRIPAAAAIAFRQRQHGNRRLSTRRDPTASAFRPAAATALQATASASIVVVGQPTAFTVSQVGGNRRLRARRPNSPSASSLTSSRTRFRRLPRSRGRRPAPPAGAAAPQFTTSGSTTTVTFAGGRQIRLQRQADRCLREFRFGIDHRNREPDAYQHRRHARHRQHSGRRDAAIQGPRARPVPAGDGHPAAFTWSASGGTISSAGLFTAPSTAGTYSVTAKSGSIAGRPP